MFKVNQIRKDFFILNQKINGRDLVYLDNAATSQKPLVMIEKLSEYYLKYNSNIHRGIHFLSQKATEKYEYTRSLISQIYNCDREGIIFTKNDTESLNLLAYCLSKKILDKKSNVIISDLEHHSNILPWQISKKSFHFDLQFAKFDNDGFLDIDDILSKVNSNTKVVSIAWASNTFGTVNNIPEIIKSIRKINPKVIIIIDAAQYVPHSKFNFKDLDADFVTFSAHKMFGPTGVGILLGKKELLEKLPPFLSGGDMIKEVTWDESTYNDLPYKFEAGTPNIADVIAFSASLEYLEKIGFENISEYENELTRYLLSELSKLKFIEIFGPKKFNENKLPVISFNMQVVHSHDVGSLLDEKGIAVRVGHHCTQLIMKTLKISSSVRASLAFYNTKEEIDKLISALKEIYKIFN